MQTVVMSLKINRPVVSVHLHSFVAFLWPFTLLQLHKIANTVLSLSLGLKSTAQFTVAVRVVSLCAVKSRLATHDLRLPLYCVASAC